MSDFARCKAFAPAFGEWRNYEEFCLARDALLLSYACAGVTPERQNVEISAFGRWARLTGAPLDLDSLDLFAAHWRWRARNPGARIRGVFGGARSFASQDVEADGEQMVCVRQQVFALWCDDYAKAGLFKAPGLDAYAALVVECCLTSKARSRRPEVNSE